MCRDFLISRPIYEATVKTFVPANGPLLAAASPTALRGRRLCRPSGFPPIDIEKLGLNVKVVTLRGADECVDMVRTGRADGVSMPAHAKQANLPGLVEAPGLSWMAPVHALAWKKTPSAAETIAALNDGLKILQKSGRWFGIVSAYLHKVNTDEQVAKTN